MTAQKASPHPLVAGVDGCKPGWVAVLATERGVAAVEVFRAFEELLERVPDAKVVAVDIPIGLPGAEPRRADVEARAFLGARGSTLFPTPPRAVLEAPKYAAARAIASQRYGRGFSAQSYNLRHKILEVDQHAGDERIIEVHPEVSFATLAGEPLLERKKTWNGQMRRRQLLAAAGLTLPDELGEAGAIPPDDILDAAAAAWTALRYSCGEARSFPNPPDGESSRRKVAIWY